MKSIVNYLKFYKHGTNKMEFLIQLRNDYVNKKHFTIRFIESLNEFLVGKYSIKKSNGVLGELDSDKVDYIVNQIKSEGYFIFDKKLNIDTVEKMSKIALNTPVYYLKSNEGKINYSKDPHKYESIKHLSNRFQYLDAFSFLKHDVFQNLALDPNFLHIANEYLGCKPIVDIVAMWWSKTFGTEEELNKEQLKNTSAQMFHFDMDRLKFIKFFVYLRDVDIRTGPHVYVKSSHNQLPNYINCDGRYSDQVVQDNDSNNIVEICGEAGTIVAVDTRGLHKGKELEKDERLIFQIEFANSWFGNPNMQKVSEKVINNKVENVEYTYRHFFKKV